MKTACISTGLRSPSALVARCSMITFATACCSVFRKRRRFSWQGGTTVGFGDWWVGGIRLLNKNGTNWKVGETSHTITKQISYNEKLKVTHNIRKYRKSKENSKKVRKVKHGKHRKIQRSRVFQTKDRFPGQGIPWVPCFRIPSARLISLCRFDRNEKYAHFL